nr:radical SAM protein [Paenibacillus piscarius]
MQAHIYSLGCTENLLDAQLYHDFLQQNGYLMTEVIADADVVILVTCGVTSYLANESMDKYSFLRSKVKEESRLIICGCLPAIERERLDETGALTFKSSHGDVTKLAEILGITDFSWDDSAVGHQLYFPSVSQDQPNPQGAVATATRKLKTLVALEREMENVYSELEMERPMYFRRITEEVYKEAYFVHVARGCGGACSFCAVRFVKGKIKSKPIAQIVKEIMRGAEEGYTEIVLAGDDVGSYGKDMDSDFYELMKELLALDLPVNYSVRNFEPFWMVNHLDKMEGLLADGRIASICVPLQSGSNRVLERMKRHYTLEQVLQAVEYLKEKYPHVLFSTHYMIGFPGETEEDFNLTLNSLTCDYFDFIRYSMYTDRPRTESSKMTDKVTVVEKLRRMKIMDEYSYKFFEEKHKKMTQSWISALNRRMEEIFY